MTKANCVPNLTVITGSANRPKLVLKTIEPSTIWIRSELPVRSWREQTSLYLKPLTEALARGIIAKRDPFRDDFFEVVLGNRWIYFHVADSLRLVYIVATASLE